METEVKSESTAKETPKSFDDIEITDSDIEAVVKGMGESTSEEKKPEEESEETTTDKEKTTTEDTEVKEKEKDAEKKEETEEKEEEEEKEIPGDPTYAIDSEGKVKHTSAEIGKWREDSDNMSNFQKSNTKKAKENAQLRKSLEPVIVLMDKLHESGESFKDSMDIMKEEFGEDVVNAALNFKSGEFPDPIKDELETEKKENVELKQELAILGDKDSLCRKHGVSRSVADEVYEYAKDLYEKTGELLKLETAYEQMRIPELEKQLAEEKAEKEKIMSEKKSPEITVTPDKKAGAQEIKTEQTMTWEGAEKAIKNDPRFKELE